MPLSCSRFAAFPVVRFLHAAITFAAVFIAETAIHSAQNVTEFCRVVTAVAANFAAEAPVYRYVEAVSKELDAFGGRDGRRERRRGVGLLLQRDAVGVGVSGIGGDYCRYSEVR